MPRSRTLTCIQAWRMDMRSRQLPVLLRLAIRGRRRYREDQTTTSNSSTWRPPSNYGFGETTTYAYQVPITPRSWLRNRTIMGFGGLSLTYSRTACGEEGTSPGICMVHTIRRART